MIPENAAPSRSSPGFEPEDLDGHTVDELTDYLESGRSPADPSIDDSPGCQLALDALERLRALTPRLLDAETAAEPPVDEGWVQRLLSGVALDARAGRRIPLSQPTSSSDLGITEGAVRGIIRAAGASIPGVIIGRSRLHGDVTVPGEPIRIHVDLSVPYGVSIPETADRLRSAIVERVRRHTPIVVAAIDIAVQDVRRRLPAAVAPAMTASPTPTEKERP